MTTKLTSWQVSVFNVYKIIYCQTSNISRTKSQNLNVYHLVLQLFFCPIHGSQVFSWEWKYSWSTTDSRCSNVVLQLHLCDQQFYAYGATVTVTVILYYINQGCYGITEMISLGYDNTHHCGQYIKNVVTFICSCKINTLRPRQNGRHFVDDIFKYIFLNENVWIPIKMSLKFVPKGPISNIPKLAQIMAWHWPGVKPLSEPMMVKSPKHLCVTRFQWVNAWQFQSHQMKGYGT